MFKIIIAYLNTASGAVVFVYVWESVMIDEVFSYTRNTYPINAAIFMLKTKHNFHNPLPSMTERGFCKSWCTLSQPSAALRLNPGKVFNSSFRFLSIKSQ